MTDFLILNIQTNPDGETKPVKILLRPDLAPNHVERIMELTSEGFYDGIVFHRAIPGFVAQCGDPTGKGTGGSDKPDLKQEFNKEPHVRGTVSMARTNNPDSSNSQFFICFDEARFLDQAYTVWGQVTEGMEVIDALPKGEPPRNPGKIVSATIEGQTPMPKVKPVHRLALELPTESSERLSKLMQSCETTSPADVIGNALRLYEATVKLAEEGYSFSKTKDGVTEPLNLFE